LAINHGILKTAIVRVLKRNKSSIFFSFLLTIFVVYCDQWRNLVHRAGGLNISLAYVFTAIEGKFQKQGDVMPHKTAIAMPLAVIL